MSDEMMPKALIPHIILLPEAWSSICPSVELQTLSAHLLLGADSSQYLTPGTENHRLAITDAKYMRLVVFQLLRMDKSREMRQRSASGPPWIGDSGRYYEAGYNYVAMKGSTKTFPQKTLTPSSQRIMGTKDE